MSGATIPDVFAMRRMFRTCSASCAISSLTAWRSGMSCVSPVRIATWIGWDGTVGGYFCRSSYDEARQLGIGVRGDDVAKDAVVVEKVDDEVAGELRHRERRDRSDRLLPVERGDEELARAREEADLLLAAQPALLGEPLGGDVAGDVDDELDRAVGAEDGVRPHVEPPLLAGLAVAAEDDPRPLLAGVRAAGRQRVEIERFPIGVEELEPLEPLLTRRGEKLLDGRLPELPRRGVVRVEEAPGRVGDRDALVDGAEDRRELLARLVELLLRLRAAR